MADEYNILRFDPTVGTIQYFSGADWYNVSIGDQEVLTTPLTGFSAGAGTVSASDTVLTAFNKLAANAGNAAIIASTLTGYTSGAGTVSSADTILSAIQKLNGNTALKLALTGGVLTGNLTSVANDIIYDNGKIVAANIAGAVAGAFGKAFPNDSSAVLEAASTTKGFLPPRMTTTQKNAIATPTESLMVYDTSLKKLCFYNGTTWETVTSS